MIARASAVLVAGVLCMLGAAPLAIADESTYLNQMRQQRKLHVDLTNSQLLRLGYVACEALRAGVSSGMSLGKARAQADRAVAATATGRLGLSYIDRASVMHITQDAEDYLCLGG